MADVAKEKDLWVHSYRMPPDSNNSIKMEVGIEDCLHIEFEYNKSKCVRIYYITGQSADHASGIT
jgi:vacuolar protein sorting-associated protein 26